MTDYAILVLGVMAARPDELLASATLAQHTQLNQTTVAKVTKTLVSAGLVVSTRGIKGGYYLDRPVDNISIADVIEAVEGPIALTACVDGVEDPCSVRNGCFMGGNWNHVNTALRKALNEVSLAELFNPESLFQVPPASLEAGNADVFKS
jgi:FeS assembly SUF system regulator